MTLCSPVLILGHPAIVGADQQYIHVKMSKEDSVALSFIAHSSVNFSQHEENGLKTILNRETNVFRIPRCFLDEVNEFLDENRVGGCCAPRLEETPPTHAERSTQCSIAAQAERKFACCASCGGCIREACASCAYSRVIDRPTTKTTTRQSHLLRAPSRK